MRLYTNTLCFAWIGLLALAPIEAAAHHTKTPNEQATEICMNEFTQEFMYHPEAKTTHEYADMIAVQGQDVMMKSFVDCLNENGYGQTVEEWETLLPPEWIAGMYVSLPEMIKNKPDQPITDEMRKEIEESFDLDVQR